MKFFRLNALVTSSVSDTSHWLTNARRSLISTNLRARAWWPPAAHRFKLQVHTVSIPLPPLYLYYWVSHTLCWSFLGILVLFRRMSSVLLWHGTLCIHAAMRCLLFLSLSLSVCVWAEWLKYVDGFLWKFLWGQTTCNKAYVSNLGYDRDKCKKLVSLKHGVRAINQT